jgi:hypothetical protein
MCVTWPFTLCEANRYVHYILMYSIKVCIIQRIHTYLCPLDLSQGGHSIPINVTGTGWDRPLVFRLVSTGQDILNAIQLKLPLLQCCSVSSSLVSEKLSWLPTVSTVIRAVCLILSGWRMTSPANKQYMSSSAKPTPQVDYFIQKIPNCI